MAQIRVNINGVEINTYSGHTILEVAETNGITIPTLCHNENLKHYGSCGMCVVELENNPKLIRACSTEIQDGMVIKTETDRILESRKTTLELMLSDHRGDCKAPCMLGCPSNVDVQGYVGLTANKAYDEALKVIKEDLPLPASIGRVCPHPCQTACRRGIVDDSISIAWIKRYVADMDLAKPSPYMPEIGPSTGKKIAVIGGGPGGLSAAYFLRRGGHDVTVYEAMPEFGGMLQYGIPLYRLPKDVLRKEVELIAKMGVELIPNTRIGRDIALSHIRSQFDAVYVSIGSWKSAFMHCKGSDAEGIIGGIEFLNKFAINEPVRTGNRIAVIGGGNTAMDACRTAIRLGAKEVYAIYRRTKADMPAVDIEIEEAEEEGVTFKFLSNPVEFMKDAEGKVTHIRLQKMAQGEPDSSGRRSVIPTDEFEVLEVDSVIMSIGQKLDPTGLEAIALNERGNIDATEGTYSTNLEGVFAGGDAINKGAGIAIEAIADGKKAAKVITEYLRGVAYVHKPLYAVKKENLTLTDFPNVVPVAKAYMGHAHPEIRMHNFEEVVHGYVNVHALEEANRCLECGCMDAYECNLFDYANDYAVKPERLGLPSEEVAIDLEHPYFMRDSNKCILCGMCVRICDEVMDHGVLGFVNRGFDAVVSPAFGQSFLETDCISCGQCISVCPTGALQEKALIHKPVPVKADQTHSVCNQCGLGCNVTLESKGELLLRSLPKKSEAVNGGLLCEKGRFELVKEQSQMRLTTPMVRKNNQLEVVSWDEAILYTARRAQSLYLRYGENALAAMVSGKYFNETIHMVKRMCKESFKTDYVYATKGYAKGLKEVLGYDASSNLVSELDGTNLILTIGTNIMEQQPVLGVRIRKAVQKGAELVVVNDSQSKADEWANATHYTENNLDFLMALAKALAEKTAEPAKAEGYAEFVESLASVVISEDAEHLAEHLLKVKNAMIIIDRERLTDEAVMLIAQISVLSGHIGRPRNGIIQLRPDGNTQGMVDMGVNMHTGELLEKIKQGSVKGLMVLDADSHIQIEGKLEFLVVQDDHLSELAQMADVVIPSPTHAETAGTMTRQDRKIQHVSSAVPPRVEMTNIEQIQRIMHIFGNENQKVDVTRLLEEIGKEVPEYLHAHESGADVYWPVGKSRVLYEDGFATEGRKAKFHAVDDGAMYVEVRQLESIVVEEAAEDVI